MGMSMHVVAIKPPDEDWKKHKAVWDACQAAEVPVPTDTERFFNEEPPDDAGVVVPMYHFGHSAKAREWNDGGSCNGIEIDIADLPPGTKTVRFVCSW